MKGIKIGFSDRIFNIAVEFPTTLFLSQRFGYFHFQVSGIEQDSEEKTTIYNWIDEKMEVDEYIEFEIIDIDKSLSSEPAEKKNAFEGSSPIEDDEMKDMYAQQLDKFYSLEEFLKKEGLI